jgi:hypothetical protein
LAVPKRKKYSSGTVPGAEAGGPNQALCEVSKEFRGGITIHVYKSRILILIKEIMGFGVCSSLMEGSDRSLKVVSAGRSTGAPKI